MAMEEVVVVAVMMMEGDCALLWYSCPFINPLFYYYMFDGNKEIVSAFCFWIPPLLWKEKKWVKTAPNPSFLPITLLIKMPHQNQ